MGGDGDACSCTNAYTVAFTPLVVREDPPQARQSGQLRVERRRYDLWCTPLLVHRVRTSARSGEDGTSLASDRRPSASWTMCPLTYKMHSGQRKQRPYRCGSRQTRATLWTCGERTQHTMYRPLASASYWPEPRLSALLGPCGRGCERPFQCLGVQLAALADAASATR